ncbi:DUF4411 family protein [Pseudohongiella nitratireducens]|uniref:DUF4411 family protein n=1 Tax=Pseudohongiella nitratireducens TaxID=1768907 RepID=UPI0030EDF462
MPKYVIDTCSLTKMRHTYPKDVFPAAWELLTDLAQTGVLISVEDVLEELSLFDDQILQWANKQGHMFFPLSQNIQVRAVEILSSHAGILDLKKNKSSADPFVIAAAIENSCSVVTEEKTSNSPIRYKIPDVCGDYGVDCIPIIDMFRREGLRT